MAAVAARARLFFLYQLFWSSLTAVVDRARALSLLLSWGCRAQMLAELLTELEARNGGSLDFSAAGILANGGGHHD